MSKRLLLASAIAAAAGCASSPWVPDTTAPATQAPPLEYRSAFAGYSSFRDEPLAPWRDANETVKEAAEPAHEHRGHR
jgi:hypothetical protein